MGLSRTWCQSGEFVLECENMGDDISLVNLSQNLQYVWYNNLSTCTYKTRGGRKIISFLPKI